MVECPLGERDREGLALTRLVQRIVRLEVDLHRKPCPGMRRQVIEVGIVGILEMQTRERQIQLHELVGGTVAPLQHGLGALDAVVVRGPELDLQLIVRLLLRRACEGDGGRQVRHDLDRPGAQRPAALRHRQMISAGERGAALEVLAVDPGEVGGLAGDFQLR